MVGEWGESKVSFFSEYSKCAEATTSIPANLTSQSQSVSLEVIVIRRNLDSK